MSGNGRHHERKRCEAGDQRGAGRLGPVLTAALCLVLLSAVGGAPVLAQGGAGDQDPGGRWFLGVSAVSSHIGADDEQPDDPPGLVYVDEVGGGIALEAGYAITPTFLLRLYLSGAQHETSDPDIDYRLGGASVEGMILFNPGRPLRPYVVGGLGGFRMESDQDGYDYEVNGGGAILGGGLRYALGRIVALDFGLRAEFINWQEERVVVDLPGGGSAVLENPVEGSGTAGKFTLGVIFRI